MKVNYCQKFWFVSTDIESEFTIRLSIYFLLYSGGVDFFLPNFTYKLIENIDFRKIKDTISV